MGPKATAALPSVILLDLYLREEYGLDVLSLLRDSVYGGVVPVLICSGSEDRSLVTRSFLRGAAGYFTKPSSMEGYRQLLWCLELLAF